MANDAVPVPASDVIHQYGLRSALDPSPVPGQSNDGGFLAQISDNPFFTAVSMPELRGWGSQSADKLSRDSVLLDLVPFLHLARKVFAMVQVLSRDVYSSTWRSMSRMNPILGSYTG